MNDLELYRHALDAAVRGECTVLVVVVDAEGSVPGTPGATMVVGPDGAVGTIGGGVAEARMIERAQTAPPDRPALVEFRHVEESLCSGTQILALASLGPTEVPALETIVERLAAGRTMVLELSPAGLASGDETHAEPGLQRSPEGWRYQAVLGLREVLTLIGGGHVSLALSRVIATLPFRIVVLDDRAELPTLEANRWAHERRVIAYDRVADHVPEGEHSWAVIMTQGHRGDRVVLERLAPRTLRYLGLLGSRAKVAALMSDLSASGISRDRLDRVHAPVGVAIGSHTPAEIAIAIAAELIRERNLGG